MNGGCMLGSNGKDEGRKKDGVPSWEMNATKCQRRLIFDRCIPVWRHPTGITADLRFTHSRRSFAWCARGHELKTCREECIYKSLASRSTFQNLVAINLLFNAGAYLRKWRK